jgi:hypothetical protein
MYYILVAVAGAIGVFVAVALKYEVERLDLARDIEKARKRRARAFRS